MSTSLLVLIHSLILMSNAFWFYGYDRVFRDPYSETSDNEIVSTAVITYLASARNNEIAGIGGAYTYKLILFESFVQYENSNNDNKWNLGVWDSFTYCDETMSTLCLYFSDGEYCDNGYFRETAIELTCHFDANVPTLYSINEYEECVYTGKLYFPELCDSQNGINTVFLRNPDEIDKIKTSSYISTKGNKINTLPYTILSATHNIGISMTVNEIEDSIQITVHGPMDRYFGIGFGSNGMLNTYAIIVDGHKESGDVYFEQLLDSHASGYKLAPSFIMDEHSVHEDNTHQMTLSRKLSSAVEIDQYWLFSCVDDYIDIIWSVGKSTTFERHIAFGEERLKYSLKQIESYDKSQIVTNDWDSANDAFKLKINWTSIFILTVLAIVGFYVVRKYKQNIIDFTSNWTGGNGSTQNESLYPASTQQYGSAQDSEPLIANKL